MALLELEGVSKSYGALKVTDAISLAVNAGEVLGILGPNGAGKTTLFNLISGDVRCDAGRVHYDGRDITGLAAHQRCRAGIGRSYQVPQPFGAMTVFENLVTAACFGAGQREQEAWERCRRSRWPRRERFRRLCCLARRGGVSHYADSAAESSRLRPCQSSCQG